MASKSRNRNRTPQAAAPEVTEPAPTPTDEAPTTDSPEPEVNEPEQPTTDSPEPEVVQANNDSPEPEVPPSNDPPQEPDTAGAVAMLRAATAMLQASEQALGVPPAEQGEQPAATDAPVRMHGGFALNTLPKHIQAIANSKRGEPTVVPKELQGVVLLPGKAVKARSTHGAAWSTKALELAARKAADGQPLGTTAEELLAAGIPLHNIKYMVLRTGWLKVAAAAPTPPAEPPKVVLSAAGAAVGLPTEQQPQEG